MRFGESLQLVRPHSTAHDAHQQGWPHAATARLEHLELEEHFEFTAQDFAVSVLPEHPQKYAQQLTQLVSIVLAFDARVLLLSVARRIVAPVLQLVVVVVILPDRQCHSR